MSLVLTGRYGFINSMHPHIITMLEFDKSEYIFHLTGSQYFGNADFNSDWDFFVQDEKGLYEYLIGLGFTTPEKDVELYPDDPNVCSVMKFGNIHVQIVKDVALKIQAQDILSKLPYGMLQSFRRNTSKFDARDWWRWAFEQAKKNDVRNK